jgi:hypothetical protein
MAQISASCKANVAPISQQQFTRPSLWWYVASRRGHEHMVDGFTTTCDYLCNQCLSSLKL